MIYNPKAKRKKYGRKMSENRPKLIGKGTENQSTPMRRKNRTNREKKTMQTQSKNDAKKITNRLKNDRNI
jgi:hypothetical protein